MKNPIAASLLLLALVLASCSSFAQPTATPTPTATSTATATPAPTATLAPTGTRLPLVATPTLDVVAALAPQGKPAAEWKGIPIMPNAIAGDGDEESYVFTVRATPQEVQKYYERELGKQGWAPLAQKQGKNSSLMLVFIDDTGTTLTVSILMKGDELLVLLVK